MHVASELILKAFKLRNIAPFDNNQIIEYRYKFVEDFDFTYTINFISHKYRKETRPVKEINLLAVQFLQYAFIFEDRKDKLEFCKKFIKRVEEDKEGFFKDETDFKEGLLIIFRAEWDSLRKAMNNTSDMCEISDRLMNIESKIDSIGSLEKYLQSFIETAKNNKKKGVRKNKKIDYSEIFINEIVGQELKNILSKFGYTDSKNLWLGQTQSKNELAIAYYVLKQADHEFQLIKTGDKRNQLLAFYKEFGLTVAKKKEEGIYTTERNIMKEPFYGDTHDNFIKLFETLKKYKS